MLQHHRRLTETEIAAPAPQIRSQFRYRRLHADALGRSRNLPNSLLEPELGRPRDDAFDVWTGCEAEPEEFPLLRSCHRALRLVHLELESLRDESRQLSITR